MFHKKANAYTAARNAGTHLPMLPPNTASMEDAFISNLDKLLKKRLACPEARESMK